MRLVRLCSVLGVLCIVATCAAQTSGRAASSEMTIDDLRAYLAPFHLREKDEVMLEKTLPQQMPAWLPAVVLEEAKQKYRSVDMVPLLYPFIKPCLSGPDIRALAGVYGSPEGQAYLQRIEEAEVASGDNDVDAAEARKQKAAKDALLTKAMGELKPAQRRVLVHAEETGAMVCIQQGMNLGADAVSGAHRDAVQNVYRAHQAEIQAAQQKFEAAAHAPAAK